MSDEDLPTKLPLSWTVLGLGLKLGPPWCLLLIDMWKLMWTLSDTRALCGQAGRELPWKRLLSGPVYMRSGQPQSDQGYVWLLSCGLTTSALVWWEKPGPWDSDSWIETLGLKGSRTWGRENNTDLKKSRPTAPGLEPDSFIGVGLCWWMNRRTSEQSCLAFCHHNPVWTV